MDAAERLDQICKAIERDTIMSEKEKNEAVKYEEGIFAENQKRYEAELEEVKRRCHF